MSSVSLNFLDECKKILQKDPDSKIFASLAEAYRKLGDLEKATQIAQKGVTKHPHFSSGHVALGQILFEKNDFKAASQHFHMACDLSPENILAHLGLARSKLRCREAKSALKSYKMVLFLNPQNAEALNAVEKLESLTADEFAPEMFSIRSLSAPTPQFVNEDEDSPAASRYVLRKLSLTDAFIARNEIEKAYEIIKKLKAQHPNNPDVQRRMRILNEHFDDISEEVIEPIAPLSRDLVIKKQQIFHLEKLLQKVQEWQKQLP